MVAALTNEFVKRHAGLHVQAISLDQSKSFAARLPMPGDQAVDVVGRQFDFGRLPPRNCLLKILPAFFDRLNFCVRGRVLRNELGEAC